MLKIILHRDLPKRILRLVLYNRRTYLLSLFLAGVHDSPEFSISFFHFLKYRSIFSLHVYALQQSVWYFQVENSALFFVWNSSCLWWLQRTIVLFWVAESSFDPYLLLMLQLSKIFRKAYSLLIAVSSTIIILPQYQFYYSYLKSEK